MLLITNVVITFSSLKIMAETLISNENGSLFSANHTFYQFLDTERQEILRNPKRRKSDLAIIVKSVVQLNKIRDKARSFILLEK